MSFKLSLVSSGFAAKMSFLTPTKTIRSRCCGVKSAPSMMVGSVLRLRTILIASSISACWLLISAIQYPALSKARMMVANVLPLLWLLRFLTFSSTKYFNCLYCGERRVEASKVRCAARLTAVLPCGGAAPAGRQLGMLPLGVACIYRNGWYK